MKPLLGILYGEWIRLRAIGAVAALLILGGITLDGSSFYWRYSEAHGLYLTAVWLFTLFFLFHLGFPRDRKGHFRSTPSLLERTLPMDTITHALALLTIRTLTGIACVFGFLALAGPFLFLLSKTPLPVWVAVAVACQQLIAIAPLLPGSVLLLAFWISSAALSGIPEDVVAIHSLLAITSAASLFAKVGEHAASARRVWFARRPRPVSQKLAAPRPARIAMILQQCPPHFVGAFVALSFSLAIFNLFSFYYGELFIHSILLMPSCGLILGLLWERDATRTTYPSPGLPVDIAEAGILRATAGMFLCAVAALVHILPYALTDLLVYDARTLLYEDGALDRQYWRGLSHGGSVRLWIVQCIQVVFATWLAFSIGRFVLALAPALLSLYSCSFFVHLIAYIHFTLAHGLFVDYSILEYYGADNVAFGVALGFCGTALLLSWAASPKPGPLRPQNLKRARYGLYLAASELVLCILYMENLHPRFSIFPATGVAIVLAWHAWSIRLIPFRTLAFLGLASTGVALLSAAIVFQLSLDTQPIARRMLLYTAYFAGSIVAGTIWQVLWLDYQRRG